MAQSDDWRNIPVTLIDHKKANGKRKLVLGLLTGTAQHIRSGAIQLKIVLLTYQRKRFITRAFAVYVLHLFPVL